MLWIKTALMKSGICVSCKMAVRVSYGAVELCRKISLISRSSDESYCIPLVIRRMG